MKIAFMPMAALVALGMVGAATSAGAQQAQQKDQMQQTDPSTANFSSEELKSYANAAIEVQKINQTYTQRLREAETPEGQQSVRKEATGKMVKAIQDEGLTVERYNAIYKASTTDPQLAQQVKQYLQEAQ